MHNLPAVQDRKAKMPVHFHTSVFMSIFSLRIKKPEWKCWRFKKKKHLAEVEKPCITKSKIQQSANETALVNRSSHTVVLLYPGNSEMHNLTPPFFSGEKLAL